MSAKVLKPRLMQSFLNSNGEPMSATDLSKYPNYLIHPELVPVIQGVFAKAPNLTFVAEGDRGNHIVYFRICDAHETVGHLQLRNSNNSDDMVLRVSSRNIKKARGDRNANETKSAKKAINIILKKCFKMPLAKVHEEFTSCANHVLSRMTYRSASKVEGELGNDGVVLLASHMITLQRGGSTEIPPELAKLLSSEPLIKLTDDARVFCSVMGDMKANRGAVVKCESDGSLLVAHLGETEVKRYKTTYDLPVYYQEKLAMLKILEQNQVVESVGMRFDPMNLPTEHNAKELFFLVSGDTVIYS